MGYPSLKSSGWKEGFMLYRAPRGTADILPQEQGYWRFIEEKIDQVCRLYGYGRIDSPAFEDSGLFSRSIGEGTDIVEKEMYTFDDKGGNSLTLRPEGTAPVCRAYLEHGMANLTQPVKMYYVTSIFRYERPQAGRYRQHRQFGCEAIGEGDPTLDAEVIDIAWRFFASLGLTGLSLVLNSIGCKQCRPSYLDALKSYYAGRSDELCADCKKRLQKNALRLLDCKRPQCQPNADRAPKSADHLCPQCREHFDRVLSYLKLLKLPYEIDHRLVRGLDYYTRTVFEIQPGDEGAQSTLGGGGRYDDLIEELGGKPAPAVGFAVGMDRIILNLKKQGVAVPDPPQPQVFLAYLGDEAKSEAIKLAASLRKGGAAAIVAAGDRSLKSQLKQADKLGARYTVIIGENELKAGAAVLRDMSTSEQRSVPLKELKGQLK